MEATTDAAATAANSPDMEEIFRVGTRSDARFIDDLASAIEERLGPPADDTAPFMARAEQALAAKLAKSASFNCQRFWTRRLRAPIIFSKTGESA